MQENNKGNAKAPENVTMGTALVLCVLTALSTLMAAFFLPPIAAKYGVTIQGNSTPRVVSMDFEKLLAAGIQKSLATPMPASDVEAHAQKFQADISAALRRYTDAGYLVVNHKALIAGAPALDITEAVMKELGVKQ